MPLERDLRFGQKWVFDAPVASDFDDMLERSIPQLETMRQEVFELASGFVQQHTSIIDLGCASGGALSSFVSKFGAHNRFIGIDASEPMLDVARHRFAGYINCGVVEICNLDLRTSYPPHPASVTLCILTLQFTPIEYRQAILRRVFNGTVPGGIVILVEKVIGSSAILDALFVDRHHRFKEHGGYSKDEILRKQLSLEGVLVPVTYRWNEELLRSAGFAQVECFWRWMNFAGWIAIRE